MVAKGKKRKAIAEVERPNYESISREDFEKRFEKTLGVLLLFQNKISVVEKYVKEFDNNKNAEIEYNYLNDNEGPPLKPIYIRQFLSKFTYADKKNKEKYNHWLCKVNERWILQQPPLPENLSRDNIRKEFELLDNVLVKHVTLCLKTLDKLRIFLANTSVEIRKAADFKEVKEELILKIHRLLTKFMNQILFRTEHFMDIQDACTSKYHYSSELFQFGFWMLRNVPIKLDDQFSKQEEVRLESLNVRISIPRSSLFENLVLRGIHWEDDLYSETGHTFNGPHCTPNKNHAHVFILEHKTKLELMAAKKEAFIQKRELYIEWLKKTNKFPVEEHLPLIAVKPVVRPQKKPEVPGLKTKKNKTRQASKPKEIITVPPEITKNDIFDAEQEFNELEEVRFLDLLGRFDPRSMDMESSEVNQRQFIILGGIYEFDFVKKPYQTVYGTHVVISNIAKQNNAEKSNIELESSNKSMSMHMSEVFKITFKIPSHLSKWSTPMVCKWLPGEGDQGKKHDHIRHKEDIIEDFDLNALLKPSQLDDIKKHLIPRIGSSSILPERLLIETDINNTLKNITEEALKYIEKRRIPENLFTIFEAVPAVKVVSNAKKAAPLRKQETESKNFSDILKELETMKIERKSLLEQFQQYNLLKGGDSSNMEPPSKSNFPEPELRGRGGANLQNKSSRLTRHKKTESQISTGNNFTSKKEASHADVNTQVSMSRSGLMEPRNIRSSRRKSKKQNHKKRNKSLEESESLEDVYEEVPTTMTPKWSTRHIVKTVFDSDNSEITIWTKELGIYGFAFARYAHFPFYNWTMVPHPEDRSRIIFKLRSRYLRFEIEITEDGYMPKVIDNQISFKTVCYLQTEEPIENLVLLKKKLQDNNFNIFTEKDAVIYIPDALEKHYSLELHTYECMGLCCAYMQFCKSNWNKFSPRRILIMQCGGLKEDIATLDDVKITPEEAQFVTISMLPNELQSSNAILLDFNPSWKNIRFSANLWVLIQTSYANVSNMQRPSEKPRLCQNVITLLKAIRPLSFSV